jgi:hypothetical protein
MSETPNFPEEQEYSDSHLPFINYEDVKDRARNPDHEMLLLDVAVARGIMENLPGTVDDVTMAWARDNVAHTKARLTDFEANGYSFPQPPEFPPNQP